MNKFSKILYAAMALAMAVCNFSCSDDEELPTGDLELNSGSSVTTETLKVLSYNVLEGMKLDKANDYNNFVTWVSEQAPDIMAIEETNGFTKEKLTALSSRWGHNYAEMCKESGYPVSITSKYPIEVVSRILDGVWHGGIHVKIKGINILVLHLYPFSYTPSGSNAANGDAYRLEEIQTYLDNTIRKYPDEKYWLMMGDFNSRSSRDNWFYKYPADDTRFLVHDYILQNTPYVDVIAEKYPGEFKTTTGGKSRIDFVYCTPALYKLVTHADVVTDDYTTPVRDPGNLSNFWHPSDHRPIVVDFNLK